MRTTTLPPKSDDEKRLEKVERATERKVAAKRKKRQVKEAHKEPRLGGGPTPAAVAPSSFPAPRPTFRGRLNYKDLGGQKATHGYFWVAILMNWSALYYNNRKSLLLKITIKSVSQKLLQYTVKREYSHQTFLSRSPST